MPGLYLYHRGYPLLPPMLRDVSEAKNKKNRRNHRFQYPRCASTLTTRSIIVPSEVLGEQSPKKADSPATSSPSLRGSLTRSPGGTKSYYLSCTVCLIGKKHLLPLQIHQVALHTFPQIRIFEPPKLEAGQSSDVLLSITNPVNHMVTEGEVDASCHS